MRFFLVLFFAIAAPFYVNGAEGIVFLNKSLIDIIKEDNFSPPVAGRVHVYPNLAYYHVFSSKKHRWLEE